ncbi:hypothetical protein [Streptomyces sp. NRRL WC-3774]|nr:hypothetical protein [Streptomyces sp. NRRL WC-3774]
MEFQDELAAGVVLVRPALQSPDYVTGVSGWAIKIDGSAEFNNVVIRGGTTVSGLALYYDGTPAAGNLLLSIASAAGTDSFGNAYVKGLGVYGTDGDIELSNGQLLMSGSDGSAVNLFSNFGSATVDLVPADLVGTSWNSATLNTSLGSANRPSLSITSPSDSVNTRVSGIEMFGGGPTTTDTSILIDADRVNFNHDVEVSDQLTVNSIDVGAGLRACIDLQSNITGITATEVTLMTVPSMTYKNGRAYRVHLWGLANSTTASTYFLYRLRKGTGTGGTIYKDQMRVPVLSTASTNSAVDLTFILVNTSGADITTAVTWTGSCAAGTGIFAASAGNRAHATVEDVGLSADWVGQPIS